MSDDTSHQNPSLQTPHKINNNNKHSLVKTKPTKRFPRSIKTKINNNINNKNTEISTPERLLTATTNIGVVSNINKPLKVVHISNPMKFEVTPTEFRDLVHRLTGRDAVVEDWCTDDYHRVNHQPTVVATVSVDGDGSSSYNGGVNEDDNLVVQELLHQDNNTCTVNNGDDDEAADVTSFSACFTPTSDHLSFDCFETFNHGYIDEDFRALMGDN